MKATRAGDAHHFTDIPNIGPRMAEDFERLGLKDPAALRGKDPLKLYQEMNELSGTRQDPCVLDTYMAAIDFMNGGEVRPWWSYTEERKQNFPDI